MKEPASPFSCSYSPDLPELLTQLNCTIAVSTYQAGKLIFISAVDNEQLVQLPRTFNRVMAVGIDGNRLALATRDEIVVLAHEPGLAPGYPKQPDTYDTLYVPRASYYCGAVDIHGLSWGKEGLWAVNTSFSCLSLINDTYSFIPKWTPSFISQLASEDRCHLNGIATTQGTPVYVTALGTGNERESWRKTLPGGGILMDVKNGEIIIKELPMPHSPRLYDGKLYMLLSATGEIVTVEPEKGRYEVINRIDGFIRGMSKCGDYLFIGFSRLRKNASTFKDLPIAEKAKHSGFSILHMPTGSFVSHLRYLASVDEIYDIQVLPGLRRPGILNTEDDTHRRALTTPESTFWGGPVKSGHNGDRNTD